MYKNEFQNHHALKRRTVFYPYIIGFLSKEMQDLSFE